MNSQSIQAAAFHPMRGHVAEGVKVAFPGGTVLTVKATMRGWTLVDAHGRQQTTPTHDANALTASIVKIETDAETLVA